MQEKKDTKEFRKRNKSTITPQQLLDLGKLPPQAVDIEEVVLGALMLDVDTLTNIVDILSPETFYKEAHQRIFSAIRTLFTEANPVDILTVVQQLKKTGELEIAGGAFYVTQLTNKIASTANTEMHARIIIEKYIQRELIRISTDTLQLSYEDSSDVFELLAHAEQNIFSISNTTLKKTFEHIKQILSRTLHEIESAKNQEFSGTPSGFTSLDKITGGWHKSDLIIIAARPGNGKCLGKGTKIIMFDGTIKNVEHIKKGDLLMGPDSNAKKVLSTTSGIDKMYWIRQNKGVDYRVNSSHILSLKKSRNNYWYKNGIRHKARGCHGDIINISLSEYINQSKKFINNHKGYKVAIDFISKKLPIDPYFLGVWIGDGCSEITKICTPDKEIIKYLREYAKEIGLKLKSYIYKNKTYGDHSITKGYQGGRPSDFSLKRELTALGVINNKHIPNQYLINSIDNRMQLLAGLLDTDGHLSHGGYEIIQKSKPLIEQIKFLADSLGFRTKLSKKTGTIKSINFKGEYFRLSIYGNIEKIPLKIKRKQYKEFNHRVDGTMTGIKVEYDKIDEYYGFELDGDGLFLLEDFTVTHNSSMAVTVARNAAVDFNKPVAIFSLEMSSTQLVSRLISSEAEISADKLRNGEVTDDQWQQIHRKISRLADAPIYIDDTPSLSIFEFRAKARRLKQQHNISMIIVDYLQLMVGSENKFSREQEVSLISRSLKAIAKELDIPIIALSQMSRSVEQRGGTKRPQLSDLRESGAIEQDADVVMFIYRAWICGVQEDEQGMSTEGIAEIIIAKHRNGRLDSAKLHFIEHFAKFADQSDSNFQSSRPEPAPTFSDNEPPEIKIEPNHEFLNQGPAFDPTFDI